MKGLRPWRKTYKWNCILCWIKVRNSFKKRFLLCLCTTCRYFFCKYVNPTQDWDCSQRFKYLKRKIYGDPTTRLTFYTKPSNSPENMKFLNSFNFRDKKNCHRWRHHTQHIRYLYLRYSTHETQRISQRWQLFITFPYRDAISDATFYIKRRFHCIPNITCIKNLNIELSNEA